MKHEQKIQWLKNQVNTIILSYFSKNQSAIELVALWENNTNRPDWYWDDNYSDLILKFVEEKLVIFS